MVLQVQKQVIMQVKLERRQNLSRITFCYHCGLLIRHFPKIQRVLMMMDPNLQVMMERRLMKIQENKVNVMIKRRKIMLTALTMLMLLAQTSPNPTTRIHKDHPLDQVIGDLQSATQTRKMSKNLKEHEFEEPKKVIHALKDPSWMEAIQEELLQFNLQEVWTLVNLPNGKRAIGSKWVFRNKKDERRILIRNKARLVAQGYTQEEGIDYNEVFAPCGKN
ncbi:putative ribonuclease H-like domain-containing protein [Tanacetum coccineum]